MALTRYLLDTGAMGDLINHRRNGARIGTCMPVVGELFFGIEASATRDKNLPRLIRALSRTVCWPFDRDAAEEYGRLAAELRRIGRPMQQIDIQIGAIARVLPRCIVVSNDSDLMAIPAISVENWAS